MTYSYSNIAGLQRAIVTDGLLTLQTTFLRKIASTAGTLSSASQAQAYTGDRQQHPVVGVVLVVALHLLAPAYHRLSGV